MSNQLPSLHRMVWCEVVESRQPLTFDEIVTSDIRAACAAAHARLLSVLHVLVGRNYLTTEMQGAKRVWFFGLACVLPEGMQDPGRWPIDGDKTMAKPRVNVECIPNVTTDREIVLRPGSLDFKQHPRIDGNRRVWPDGRWEFIK